MKKLIAELGVSLDLEVTWRVSVFLRGDHMIRWEKMLMLYHNLVPAPCLLTHWKRGARGSNTKGSSRGGRTDGLSLICVHCPCVQLSLGTSKCGAIMQISKFKK